MSGHSKWAQIKRAKGAADVKRGKLFGQLAKAITIAARLGKNLDTVVATARAANMPKDNIERAIKRGTGESGDGVQIDEVVYEAYGPGGAALLITALTDNRNRTIGELRAVANKQGLTLAQPGAVRFLFAERGIIEIGLGDDPDAAELALIDAGADEIERADDRFVGFVAPEVLSQALASLGAAGMPVLDSRLVWVPTGEHEVTAEQQEQLLGAMERLEELDDVSAVETNARFAD